MKKYLFFAFIILTLVCGVFFTACQRQQAGGAGQVFTLRLAHVAQEAEVFHVMALRFKEQIEQRSNGRIIVNIFPAGQLGNEREIIESLQLGVIDLGVVSTANVVNFVPAFAALDLPWVFRGWDHALAVAEQPFIQELFSLANERDLAPLGFLHRGFRNVCNSVRPIYTPADIRGLRLRVVESPLFVATFAAVGANVTAMAWGEVFTAMQQGAIDAAEMPLSQFYNERMFEVQNFYSLTEHIFAFSALIASNTLMNRLPPDLQALVRETAAEVLRYSSLQVRADEAEQIRRIEARGVRVNTVPDAAKTEFRRMVQGFYDTFLATADPATVRFVSFIEATN